MLSIIFGGWDVDTIVMYSDEVQRLEQSEAVQKTRQFVPWISLLGVASFTPNLLDGSNDKAAAFCNRMNSYLREKVGVGRCGELPAEMNYAERLAVACSGFGFYHLIDMMQSVAGFDWQHYGPGGKYLIDLSLMYSAQMHWDVIGGFGYDMVLAQPSSAVPLWMRFGRLDEARRIMGITAPELGKLGGFHLKADFLTFLIGVSMTPPMLYMLGMNGEAKVLLDNMKCGWGQIDTTVTKWCSSEGAWETPGDTSGAFHFHSGKLTIWQVKAVRALVSDGENEEAQAALAELPSTETLVKCSRLGTAFSVSVKYAFRRGIVTGLSISSWWTKQACFD